MLLPYNENVPVPRNI